MKRTLSRIIAMQIIYNYNMNKVLLIAFYGKYNSSNMLVNMIDDNVDKLILTNSL